MDQRRTGQKCNKELNKIVGLVLFLEGNFPAHRKHQGSVVTLCCAGDTHYVSGLCQHHGQASNGD